ncbi:cytochrome P450 [Paenibacillus sp. CC-CFT747]|nr:cytochrome P450 [Paenibacillus sp. CC-CFT747]
MSDYFDRMITERRANPREDLISEMVASQQWEEGLTDLEIIATCTLLLVAGHETTVNLIGNGIRTLLIHADQLEKLLHQPEWMPWAVEEALRYESPVQMTSRFASADYELRGKTIRQGQSVQVMLAAANRDNAKFHQPDRFLIDRTPNPHIAFATGSHYCLGAPLARMEGRSPWLRC